jgi:hypothetical protein
MIKRTLYLTAWLTGCLGSGASLAYSIDNHDALSNLAVKRFNHCAKELASQGVELTSLGSPETRAIIEGSKAEDEQAPLKRASSWHFYDPARRLGDKSILVFRDFVDEPALHERFNELEIFTRSKLQISGIGDAYIYRSVGRMLHYLQDVTVPAHVVPVFHPSPKKLGDAFDSYEISGQAFNEGLADGGATCDAMWAEVKSVNSFNDLLNKMGDHTLDVIDKETVTTKEGVQGTWSKQFWSDIPSEFCRKKAMEQMTNEEREAGKKPSLDHCFGTYGVFGNNFGNTSFCDSLVVFGWCSKTRHQVAEEVYKQFALARHRDAVEVSVKAMMLLQRMQFQQ